MSRIEESCREAAYDVLSIDHSGGQWYGNDRPEVVAARIAKEIEKANLSSSGEPLYRDIILVGHSAGGLLLRKAFIFAASQNDFAQYDDSDNPQEYKLTWATHIKRIITLASLDRGFSLGSNQVAAGDSLLKAGLRTVAFRAAQLIGVGGFIRAFRRGTPFIVNTRVQWIRLSQRAHVPAVFQLIGDRDDLIGERDNVDVLLRSPNYTYLPVTGATHASILRLDTNADAAQMFTRALTLPSDSGLSENDDVQGIPAEEKPSVTGIVYVMHGIRDVGTEWADQFANEVENASNFAFRAVHLSYGYFSALEFVFRTRRMRNVRWFMDVYTEQIAKNPHADHYYFGHSNGTYVIGNAMRRYVTCRMKRIALAGSVLPVDYDWAPFMPKRVVAVRNDVGSADIVVALLPRLWEDAKTLVRFLNLPSPPIFDLGAAGVLGFLNGCTYQSRYVEPCWTKAGTPSLLWKLREGHGAALNRRNAASIAKFFVSGTHEPIETGQLPLIGRITKFGWILPIALIALGTIATTCLAPRIGPGLETIAATYPIAFWAVLVMLVLALILFALTF